MVGPLSSQRPDTGIAAASSTAAGEPTTGSVVGMGGLEHAEGTPDPEERTRRTKTIRRRGKRKKAARGGAVVHAPESEVKQGKGSEPSSGKGEQQCFRWGSAASAEGAEDVAVLTSNHLVLEDGVCCPCFKSGPLPQRALRPETLCEAGSSLKDFLADAEWRQVQMAARHLCPGHAARMCDAGVAGFSIVGDLISYTLAEGLQEIEGWLDFGQATEDLDTLENDIFNGGTTLTVGGRQNIISVLSRRLANFLELAAEVKTWWTGAVSQADKKAQYFVQRAAELCRAQPLVDQWQIGDSLVEEIEAFVQRAVGGGTGDVSHEAAGNFGLLIGAVDECMRQAREMAATLRDLTAESHAQGEVAASPPLVRT